HPPSAEGGPAALQPSTARRVGGTRIRQSLVSDGVAGPERPRRCGRIRAVPFYADLHVHSKYSRACSRDCDLEHLAWWAGRKGIAVVGTGDFTHPAWAEELRTRLVPAEPALFRLRGDLEREVLRRLPAPCRTPVRFLLSTEISTI